MLKKIYPSSSSASSSNKPAEMEPKFKLEDGDDPFENPVAVEKKSTGGRRKLFFEEKQKLRDGWRKRQRDKANQEESEQEKIEKAGSRPNKKMFEKKTSTRSTVIQKIYAARIPKEQGGLSGNIRFGPRFRLEPPNERWAHAPEITHD